MYVVNLCVTKADGKSHWYLNALNIYTGANYAPPVEIQYTTADVSANPHGPQQEFSAIAQLQRASLLLVSGKVGSAAYKSLLAGFGTSVAEDGTNAVAYQGWMFNYDVNTSDPTYLTFNYNQNGGGYSANALPYITQCQANPLTSGTPYCNSGASPNYTNVPNPCGDGGGAWMAARAPAANTNSSGGNDVFFTAGNGGFNYCPTCTITCAGPPSAPAQYFTDFGEAVMETSMQTVWSAQPTSTSSTQAPFWPTSYFVPLSVPAGITNPSNCGISGTSACGYFQILNQQDWDMGDSGVMIFDDDWYSGTETVPMTSMALSATKRGDGYVMLQSNLGQYNHPDQTVARFTIPTSNLTCTTVGSQICDEPRTLAYWNPASANGFLVAWPWNETAESFQWLYSSVTSQYTFQPVTTASNPFSGLAGTPTTGYAGGALAITYNPTESPTAAVVWAAAAPYPNPTTSHCSQRTGLGCFGYLLAYSLDASGNLSSSQIWPSTLPATPDFAPAPYAIPTAANGTVYVPAYALCSTYVGGNCTNYLQSGVQVYGF
jgi:hypothetical protein